MIEHFYKAPTFYESNNDLDQNDYHRKMLAFIKVVQRFNSALVDCRITCVGLFAESYVGYLTIQENAAKMLKDAPEKSKKFWLKIAVSLTFMSDPQEYRFCKSA